MAETQKIIRTEGKPKSKAPQPLVAQPLRDTEGPRDPENPGLRVFFSSIAASFPSLKKTLVQADMRYTPASFVQSAAITAACITAVLMFATAVLIWANSYAIPITLPLFFVFYPVSFIYVMQFPGVKAKQRAKRIDQELVFAGRHMLIELKAGVPLFDSMLGISRDYGELSSEFSKVVEKVTLGVSMGVALHDIADNNPSRYFKRVIMQMANSLASGSDVATALEAALDQISREQVIELKAYGQKLNPLVMFFMIFGIIMPSLGVAFIIIITSFLGGSGVAFGPSALFGILIAVGLVQLIFLSMVENSRPKFQLV